MAKELLDFQPRCQPCGCLLRTFRQNDPAIQEDVIFVGEIPPAAITLGSSIHIETAHSVSYLEQGIDYDQEFCRWPPDSVGADIIPCYYNYKFHGDLKEAKIRQEPISTACGQSAGPVISIIKSFSFPGSFFLGPADRSGPLAHAPQCGNCATVEADQGFYSGVGLNLYFVCNQEKVELWRGRMQLDNLTENQSQAHQSDVVASGAAELSAFGLSQVIKLYPKIYPKETIRLSGYWKTSTKIRLFAQ